MRIAILMLLAAACSAGRDGVGTDGTMHGPHILDRASDDFHGKLASRLGFDLSICMRCHDQSKPGAAPACARCHQDGEAGCTSCHGKPPTTGAHLAHAGSGASERCRLCHPTPNDWRDPGHLGDAPKFQFAAIAGPNATFDGTRCQNVYCHGAAFDDSAAANRSPAWNGGPGEAACGNCHGKPPANHGGGYACATCHPADAPHVDGIVEIGRTSGCDGCHGSAASPAPPTDLSGNIFTTALTVGAHQAHLLVPNKLRGPIPCATCHKVPTKITDVGHIDSGPPAEVDPVLGWDRTSATCTVWCHGPSRPVWTTTGAAVCGACHGVPPADANHTPDLQPKDCHTCHPGTIDVNGYPIVTDGPNGPTSEHINGHVDL